MLRKILLMAVVVLLGAGQSLGAIIFQLISTENSSTVVSQASGVVGTGYSRGNGLTLASGGTFNSQGFNLNGNEAAAISSNDFVEWSFTSSSAIDLTSFDIRYDRSAEGPSELRIDFSSNGGAFTTVHNDANVSVLGENNLGIILNSTGVTAGAFRLFAWGATDTNGTFDLENNASIGVDGANPVSFELNGTITSVPEPSSISLVSLMGCSALVAAYRRRKAKSKVA